MDQAEQLRKLVKQQNQGRSVARVITVTSGKGGVGKSSTAVNLAVELVRLGKRVIILDVDFGLANIEVMFGVRPMYNLADLMFHGKTLSEIVTKGPEGVGFISGGSGIQELTRLSRDQIISLTQKLVELDEIADVILIDTGAGISDNVLEFVSSSSEVLLVATPEPTSITDAYALLKTLNTKNNFSRELTKIRLIANRASNDKEGIEIYEKLNSVVNKFLDIEVEHLGTIPHDALASKAVMNQQPVVLSYPNTSIAKAYIAIANRLCNGEDAISNTKKGIAQLFTNLIKEKYRVKRK